MQFDFKNTRLLSLSSRLQNQEYHGPQLTDQKYFLAMNQNC